MDIEGCVRIELGWDAERVCEVRVASNRTDVSQALLAGRRPDEAEVLLPRVFSICARAQSTAAAAALCAARGVEPGRARHDEMAVLAETAVEYLWRFLIDLPGLFGLPQHHQVVGELRRELNRTLVRSADSDRVEGKGWLAFISALRHAVFDGCFGEDAGGERTDPEVFMDWEARSDANLAGLLRAVRRTALLGQEAILLPALSQELLGEIGAELERDRGFSRRPEIRGVPAECGARSRLAAHPVLQAARRQGTSSAYQRILARLIELTQIPERLHRLLDGQSGAVVVHGLMLGPGRGIAGVETARGLLVHWANVENERVVGYRIVAPTEWNFHPRGALLADLADAPAGSAEQARQVAGLAIQSLDPCVRFEIKLTRLPHA